MATVNLMRVKEWSRVKLIGKPSLTGRGLWVALRPLPRLVHIYYDSNLRGVLRFPKDPRFLLLVPSEDASSNLGHEKESANGSESISLLVLTSDGGLWFIPQITPQESGNRPAKKAKQTPNEVMEKWDIFEECDIYKDAEFYPYDEHVCGRSESASGDPSKIQPSSKVLKLKASGNEYRKLHAEDVQSMNFIGRFVDACVASIGPNNLIVVASSTRSPIVLSKTNPSVFDFTSANASRLSSIEGCPSCLLFATIREGRQSLQTDCFQFSPHFFNAVTRNFGGARPKHLLFQGNTAGEVHVFPVDSLNHISSPLLLFDLQESISGLIAFALNDVSDVLLAITYHGLMVSIIASQSKSASPFSTSMTEPTVRKLLKIEVGECFSVQSRRVKAPVLSITSCQPGQLCIHSASGIYIINMLDNICMEQTSDSTLPVLPAKIPMGMTFKNSPICKAVPFFDVVIAATEGDAEIPQMGSRFFVVLTSRGKLVELQVPENIMKASPECFILEDNVNSWKPNLKNRTGDVMFLIDEIAAVDTCAKALEAMKTSIDNALSELAISLKLSYGITKDKHQSLLLSPYQPFNLPFITISVEVKPLTTSVDSQRFQFRPTKSSGHNISDWRLNFKVTLTNIGPYPLSPYWILLFDLHFLDETSRNPMFFSRNINDGCGLLPHDSSVVDFEISCMKDTAYLLELDCFLCHIHEHHDELLHTSVFLHMKTSEEDKRKCEYLIAKHLQLPTAMTSFNSSPSSKAVCLFLSSYRVDILSLLNTPRKVYTFDSLCLQSHQEQVGGQKDGLGSFFGKFQLNFFKFGDSVPRSVPDSERWWMDIGLGGIMKNCAVSKDGKELLGADVHGKAISLTLNNKQLGWEHGFLTEVQMSAPCAVMGYIVREAVLGRLKQQLRRWSRLEADRNGTIKDIERVLNMLVTIEAAADLLKKDTEKTLHTWTAGHIEHSVNLSSSILETNLLVTWK
ncbi:hypothetical protein KP509_04G099000 [Ceratopteris richardii]|uniref:Uncharacterized protein n=1 Tax=Ceratopteris richardii TaxID=49495 RepID=A0A8T2V246_CERRI|nr:hypothetical protein KP509_04G099000 [Ceratopteris richardii]